MSVSTGGNSSRWLQSGGGEDRRRVLRLCALGVCGLLGGVGLSWGVGLFKRGCVGCRVRGAVGRALWGCPWPARAGLLAVGGGGS